jgi:SAM-dependent methyltransferase
VHQRAVRALHRQASYQERKARATAGNEAVAIAAMTGYSREVWDLIAHADLSSRPRILEIGCGSGGLIYFCPSDGLRVGIDPLAATYRALFPAWHRRAAVAAAIGEALPFGDEVFDVVFCDNVIDHAERPAAILREAARVLARGGVFYFTVNIHHWIYQWASALYGIWTAVGVPFEIGPFADHTVHLTLPRARRLLQALPLDVLGESDGITLARQAARAALARHPGDRLKRLFFKNARYVAVATRRASG